MKLVLSFQLSSVNVAINYRNSVMSLIKHLLSTKYEDDFNVLFGAPTMKSYTFSVYFPGVVMGDNEIIVEQKQMSVTISGYDQVLILKLYNASLLMKNKSYPIKDNTMTLIRIRLDNPHKKIKEINVIKFLCPLIVRKREDKKDTYLTFKDEEFNKYVNMTVNNLFEQLALSLENHNIILTPYKARTTVVKQGKLSYEVSIGTFILEGNPEAVGVLYQTGIGSRRGQGFGMFEIIGG